MLEIDCVGNLNHLICSEKIRRWRIEDIRHTFSEDAIVHAANTTEQAQGEWNALKILQDFKNSPTRAEK